jgi:hypothetical protein
MGVDFELIIRYFLQRVGIPDGFFLNTKGRHSCAPVHLFFANAKSCSVTSSAGMEQEDKAQVFPEPGNPIQGTCISGKTA